MKAEPVFSVWDYYDGVLSGVASYSGEPYYFEREWSVEQKDYLPTFRLIRISAEELAEVLTGEAIYRAWEARFRRGEVDADTHPGEAGGPSSYEELQAQFQSRDTAAAPRLVPDFSAAPGQPIGPGGVMARLQVVWQEVV